MKRREMLQGTGASVLAKALHRSANAQASTRFRFANFSPTSDPNHVTALAFADAVKRAANGAYEVTILPNAQLDGEVAVTENVLLGAVDSGTGELDSRDERVEYAVRVPRSGALHARRPANFPGPIFVAKSAQDRRPDRLASASRVRLDGRRGSESTNACDPRPRRSSTAPHQSLPEPALGRLASAGRNCLSSYRRAKGRDLRRAYIRTGRLRSIPDPQSAARVATRLPYRLPVYQPQFGGRSTPDDARCRHVSGARRRTGRNAVVIQGTQTSLNARLVGLGPDTRTWSRSSGSAARHFVSKPNRSPDRLRFTPPLSFGDADLQRQTP